MNAKTQRRYSRKFFNFIIFFFVFSSGVWSQNLDDFRTAAAADGVQVIPFPSLRNEAASKAAVVQSAKVEATKYNYDTYSKQKANLLAEIRTMNVRIKSEEEEKEKFKREHPDGSISTFDEDIRDLKEELEDLQDNLEDLNDDVLDEAAEAWKEFAEARSELRKVFERAKSELSSAYSYPDRYLGSSPSQEDINLLKKYIDIIEDEIEVNARTHKEQEDGANATARRFEDLIRNNG